MAEILLPEEGWVYEDVCEYEFSGLVRDKSMELNRRNFCTHIAQARVEFS